MKTDFLSGINAYNKALNSTTNFGSEDSENIDFGSVLNNTIKTSSSSPNNFASPAIGAVQSAISSVANSEKVSNLAMAKQASLSDVVIALSQAETVLQQIVAVRDKVITAYQEIIKMPI
jgi:flagellar hook-basal body complex protein FliE